MLILSLRPASTFQVEKIHLLDDETARALGSALAKVAKKVCKATETEEYNVIVNNGKNAVGPGALILCCPFCRTTTPAPPPPPPPAPTNQERTREGIVYVSSKT